MCLKVDLKSLSMSIAVGKVAEQSTVTPKAVTAGPPDSMLGWRLKQTCSDVIVAQPSIEYLVMSGDALVQFKTHGLPPAGAIFNGSLVTRDGKDFLSLGVGTVHPKHFPSLYLIIKPSSTFFLKLA
jgi:hypothetical protein